MSKDLLIAGIVLVVCSVLTIAAFMGTDDGPAPLDNDTVADNQNRDDDGTETSLGPSGNGERTGDRRTPPPDDPDDGVVSLPQDDEEGDSPFGPRSVDNDRGTDNTSTDTPIGLSGDDRVAIDSGGDDWMTDEDPEDTIFVGDPDGAPLVRDSDTRPRDDRRGIDNTDDAPGDDLFGTPGTSTDQRTYVVRPGDTLAAIAARELGSEGRWQSIRDANPGVDPRRLREGQELILPSSDRSGSAVPIAQSGSGRSYVVQRGDSYYTIARDRLGDVALTSELERINDVAAHALQPGMRITLPDRALIGSSQPRAASTPASGDANVHVVQRGDTLGAISQARYGTTRYWRRIEAANPGIDPNNLVVGTRLTLPDLPRVGDGGSAAADHRPTGGDSYVIEPGDTLASIAQRRYGNADGWRAILAANPDLDPTRLRVGRRITLPGEVQLGRSGTLVENGQTYHVVAPGEILGTISLRYYGTSRRWREIRDANPEVDPEYILPGTRLLIPGARVSGGGQPDTTTEDDSDDLFGVP